jgi:hypothetical protein
MPRSVLSLLTALAAAAPATAQLIAIKTVPVAQGDQFAIFLSDNAALGGVAIALADTLLDPLAIPRRGARRRGTVLRLSHAVQRIRDAGGGRPAARRPALAAPGSVAPAAFQQVDAGRRPEFFPTDPAGRSRHRPAVPALSRCAAAGGRRVPRQHLRLRDAGRSSRGRGSVGASALWAGLNAVDGVDLLYAGSQRIRQSGHALDLRLDCSRNGQGTGRSARWCCTTASP